MAIKGLDQAIDNLSRVRKNAIPAASAMTINRVATTAINQSSSQVARETRVRRKLVKERSRLKRATVRNPNARIIVNRGDLPVIKLGIRMLGRRPNSILKAGQHRYQRAFIQRLNNGRWHVMQRLPQARYEEGNDDKGRKKRNRLPIQVVKIPMAAPLKQAFDENVDRTRTVKVTNVGKPSVAEERSKITPVSAIKVTPTSGTVAKGKTTTLTVSLEPESATDKTFRAVSADPSKATISVKDMTITVNGVATGKVQIPVVSGNGQFAAVAEVTVTEAGAAG